MGQIIYLQASYETIASRVSQHPQRGLILQPKQSLRDIYLERSPLYQTAADLVLSTEENSIHQCVKKIKDWMHASQLQP
ncbi:MAG: shikimate kinase [Desulfohalobiaceae bacterium]